jgi:methionine synthase II (cobalamin-independent)
MAPRFPADQIGSLLRPQEVLDAQTEVYSWGQMHNELKDGATAEAVENLDKTTKQAIKDVVDEQLKRGILPITSGEFERSSFVAGFFEKLEGIEIQMVDFSQYRTQCEHL